ncbi:hypothetical protein N7478_005409 [Penicillium angulare]|uniref:uncharacterized protein n=1 Tax=Penicillium angulare TaxID=116970 RepID=UPI0025403912|nr:uncharacterized protein N7478_005409 [Penicillium angulare]KAJ5280037.1 hypothetical protein N7478_005409 [Penicillium angulare]
MISPSPATVYDLGLNGDPIESTKRSAARKSFGSYSWSGSTPSRPSSPTFIEGRPAVSGSVEKIVKQFSREFLRTPLTIFTSGSDKSVEHNEIPECQFRKVFFTDDTSVVDPTAVSDMERYVRMTVFISKSDEGFENPKIFVEQQVFRSGCKCIVAHVLAFNGKIKCDVDYRFPDCGDEIQPGRPRDLILRVKSLDGSIFDSRMANASYYGYDMKRSAYVDEESISRGLDLPWEDASPILANHFTGEHLKMLLNTQSKKVVPVGGRRKGKQLFYLNLLGFGRRAGDGSYVGDLQLEVVYVY